MDKVKIIKSETEELLKKIGLSVDEVSVKTEDEACFVQIKSIADAPFLSMTFCPKRSLTL